MIRIFIRSKGKSTPLYVSKNEKISEGKKKFGRDYAQWEWEGDVLINEKTFEEYGIEEDDNITSIELKGGGGFFGVNTIDVSKNKTKNLGFDNDAPIYRLVSYGLNIQSKCKNKNCKAFEDVIYIQFDFCY